MRKIEFEKLVQEILDELPKEFAERIENVEFTVKPHPSKADQEAFDIGEDALLGFYLGTPLDQRSPTGYAGALPDRILIFQENVEDEAGNPNKIRKVLRDTVLHEIGHFFGLSEERLEELGLG